MTKYKVHFMGYYSYDVMVEAENEDEAGAKATPIYENADPSEFDLVFDGTEISEDA